MKKVSFVAYCGCALTWREEIVQTRMLYERKLQGSACRKKEVAGALDEGHKDAAV